MMFYRTLSKTWARTPGTVSWDKLSFLEVVSQAACSSNTANIVCGILLYIAVETAENNTLKEEFNFGSWFQMVQFVVACPVCLSRHHHGGRSV